MRTALSECRYSGSANPVAWPGFASDAGGRTAANAATATTASAVTLPVQAAAPTFTTPAPVAYLKDLSSGAVLFARDADRRMPPASMAKMMTTHVAFDLIDKGELKLNQMVTVNPETWPRWHGPAAGSTAVRTGAATNV